MYSWEFRKTTTTNLPYLEFNQGSTNGESKSGYADMTFGSPDSGKSPRVPATRTKARTATASTSSRA